MRWFSMVDEGWPRAQTRLPWCDPNYVASRHSYVVCIRQENHHHELTVPWQEGCDEAHERKSSKHWNWRNHARIMANLVIPIWRRMPESFCPFHLDYAQSYRDMWRNPEKSSQDTWRESRENFMLDMQTPRYQGVEIPKRTETSRDYEAV